MNAITSLDALLPAAPDPIFLYTRRRQEAVALWRSIPTQQFSLSREDWWHRNSDPASVCGLTGCALGWLGDKLLTMPYHVWDETEPAA